MKTRNLWAIMTISAGFAFFGTSCTSSENNVATDSSLTLTATDEAQAAAISDVVISQSDVYVNTLASNGYSGSMAVKGTAEVTGPVITIDKPDSTRFPKVITIDFGTIGYINDRNDTL